MNKNRELKNRVAAATKEEKGEEAIVMAHVQAKLEAKKGQGKR